MGEVMGATLSYSLVLPLRSAVSSFAENLAQFLGAGTRSREIWVLVGCPGLVIFLGIYALLSYGI